MYLMVLSVGKSLMPFTVRGKLLKLMTITVFAIRECNNDLIAYAIVHLLSMSMISNTYTK